MRRRRIVRGGAGMLLLALVALVLVPTASGAAARHTKSATLQQYGNEQAAPIVGVQGETGLLGGQAKGVLPFTGVQLTIFALGGIILIASGFLLRSTARGRSPHS